MDKKRTQALRNVTKIVLFFLLLGALLHGVSYLVRPRDAIRQARTRSFESLRVFDEPEKYPGRAVFRARRRIQCDLAHGIVQRRGVHLIRVRAAAAAAVGIGALAERAFESAVAAGGGFRGGSSVLRQDVRRGAQFRRKRLLRRFSGFPQSCEPEELVRKEKEPGAQHNEGVLLQYVGQGIHGKQEADGDGAGV